jgi:hypothetical protein|tara:strand:- start:178 stop:348 length:171 start_codon:yes stop_codon:yes gene_type:complete
MKKFKSSEVYISKFTNKKNEIKYQLLLSDMIATKLAQKDTEVLDEISGCLENLFND